EEQFRTQVCIVAVRFHVLDGILSRTGCLSPALPVFVGIQSSLESICAREKERGLHLVSGMILEKVFRYENSAVHVGKKNIVMRRVGRIRHDLPPFDQSHQKIRKRVPGIPGLEIARLLLSARKLEIVQVIQRLRTLQLNVNIRQPDNGGVFFLDHLCLRARSCDQYKKKQREGACWKQSLNLADPKHS